MEVTNEQSEETAMLTQADLALASYALAETFNAFLMAYNEEDFGESTKEEMETSMENLRRAFIKFDSLLSVMVKNQENLEEESEDDSQNEETAS